VKKIVEYYRFNSRDWEPEIRAVYDRLEAESIYLIKIYRELNIYIRENYFDVDLDKLSNEAGRNYEESKKVEK